jgi:hypothetical protein
MNAQGSARVFMGICAKELRTLVIRPTLEQLGEAGERADAAENLLLGTAAQESGLGFHLKLSRSQGLGIYRISPRTHLNIWDKYLVNQPDLASEIRGLASQHEFLTNPHAELATNLKYATAIAWMIYRRADKALPGADDIQGLGEFWAGYYHHKAKASAEEFVRNYKRYVCGNTKNLAA